jgi:hypothetical protein
MDPQKKFMKERDDISTPRINTYNFSLSDETDQTMIG